MVYAFIVENNIIPSLVRRALVLLCINKTINENDEVIEIYAKEGDVNEGIKCNSIGLFGLIEKGNTIKFDL